jgi:hypothetical protein
MEQKTETRTWRRLFAEAREASDIPGLALVRVSATALLRSYNNERAHDVTPAAVAGVRGALVDTGVLLDDIDVVELVCKRAACHTDDGLRLVIEEVLTIGTTGKDAA